MNRLRVLFSGGAPATLSRSRWACKRTERFGSSNAERAGSGPGSRAGLNQVLRGRSLAERETLGLATPLRRCRRRLIRPRKLPPTCVSSLMSMVTLPVAGVSLRREVYADGVVVAGVSADLGAAHDHALVDCQVRAGPDLVVETELRAPGGLETVGPGGW